MESDVSCGIFKRKFNHKKYKFGKKYNSTIYVYVYDFKTPFMVLVSLFCSRGFIQIVQMDKLEIHNQHFVQRMLNSRNK